MKNIILKIIMTLNCLVLFFSVLGLVNDNYIPYLISCTITTGILFLFGYANNWFFKK